jgi:hypothetical protein
MGKKKVSVWAPKNAYGLSCFAGTSITEERYEICPMLKYTLFSKYHLFYVFPLEFYGFL